jgi:hypothetical protein
MQAACYQQFPGQVTIAYPQDPNNCYSWVCLDPTAGTYTDPSTATTVVSVTDPNGDATLITNSTSMYLTVDADGNSATVAQDSSSSGDMSYEGSSGGSVLTYVGSGGGSSV